MGVTTILGQYQASQEAKPDGDEIIGQTDQYGNWKVVGPDGVALPSSTLIGALTETAPATDTASSGLNGRLQRIAQRLTALLIQGAGVATAALRTVTSSTAATDRSGTITTGGTAQNVMSSNTSRRGWAVANNSDTEMRVHPAGTASATAGIPLSPNGMVSGDETNAISVHCATTGKAFTAWEN